MSRSYRPPPVPPKPTPAALDDALLGCLLRAGPAGCEYPTLFGAAYRASPAEVDAAVGRLTAAGLAVRLPGVRDRWRAA